MSEELTPEEQQLLEELTEERFVDLPRLINWTDGYETEPGYQYSDRTPKKVNKEKVRNFLRIFGADIFGPMFDAFVDNVVAYFQSGEPGDEPFAEVNPVSIADYILVWEAQTGKVFAELPPNTQDMILQSYDVFQFQDELAVELAEKVTNDATILKNIYSKTGEIPGEEFTHIDDAVVGAAITSDYSPEAELAYQSYLSKEQHDAEIRTAAAQALDNRTATDLINQLEAGTITKKEYLEGMDNIIVASGEYSVSEFVDIVENPAEFINQLPPDFDPFLAGRIADPSSFGFIGLEEYDQEIYSSKEDGELIPMYEIGMDRLLFASASPEEIAEVQNLLVEAGFLQPYSFAYGVIDFNAPDGGTLAAINSAMSRFNLNADTISKEQLYDILLAPGATSANLITFVKEFFKDTLEDYGYGTGKFEPHSTVGYSQGYKELFKYESPNLINAQADIQFALERGLGRPVSSQEINSFVDYYNQVAYDLQKKNFDIRQKNIQTSILGEETRYQNFLKGKSDYELPTEEQQLDYEQALSSALQNYVREQYGEAITGEDQQKAIQSTLVSLLNTIGSLSSYTARG